MSTNKEQRISKFLDFPYGSFVMLRLEYVLICGDELEAKILRLIEDDMEAKRRELYQEYMKAIPKGETPTDQVIEITKDVWVPISHRTFMYDLYGTVKSENTLKRAIKSLVEKKLLSKRYAPSKQYDSPEYQINAENMQAEFDKLKASGKSGYQKLTPSKSDTLKNSPPQELIPSGGQNLIPSSDFRGSIFDTNSRIENTVDITVDNKESVGSIEHNTPPLTDLEKAIALLAQNGDNVSHPDQAGVSHEHHHHHTDNHRRSNDSYDSNATGAHVRNDDHQTFRQMVGQVREVDVPHHGSEQSPRSSGESRTDEPHQSSAILPPETNATPSLPAISSNDTTPSKTAPQRENEPLSINSETSELRIADTTPSHPAAQPTMKDRVEAVYKCYEQLCREKFENEDIEVKRRGNRTEEYKAIKDALESKDGVTPTSLRQVFLDMWNEKGREGEYFYRDLTHITIRAVCNQHGKRIVNLRFREKKSTSKSVSGLPNLTFGQGPAAAPLPSSIPFDEIPYASQETTGQERPARKFKLRRVADIEAEIAARQAAQA